MDNSNVSGGTIAKVGDINMGSGNPSNVKSIIQTVQQFTVTSVSLILPLRKGKAVVIDTLNAEINNTGAVTPATAAQIIASEGGCFIGDEINNPISGKTFHLSVRDLPVRFEANHNVNIILDTSVGTGTANYLAMYCKYHYENQDETVMFP